MVPKCSRCNSADTPHNELAFIKMGKNSWGLACKNCLVSSGTTWNTPGELRWLGSYAGLYDPDTFKLLSSIREANGKKPEKIAENERRYERHAMVLRGFVKLENDDKEVLAVIKDLSKGGLRFVSKSEFTVAQIASIRIERKNHENEENNESTINENIEIVRVIPQSNGTYEMGAPLPRRRDRQPGQEEEDQEQPAQSPTEAYLQTLQDRPHHLRRRTGAGA